MKICVLTKGDSFNWVRHYVSAFRQRAEVLAVGPPCGEQQLSDWNLYGLEHLLPKNDIETDLDPSKSLRGILPDGWNPDLIVAIGIGADPVQPSMDGLNCPTVYLSIDTWQSIQDYAECQHYDFVFAAQRAAVGWLRAAGAANTHWLPLACNPAEHYPVDVERDHDISFVGNVAIPVHQQRWDLLEMLNNDYSLLAKSQTFLDDLCRHTCRGKLVFNHSAVRDVNMRIFEVLAMRRPLLTNRDSAENGLLDLFKDGEHLIVYDGAADLVERVQHYLAHEDERERIAQAGYDLVTARHRYVDRVDDMLGVIEASVPSFSKISGLTPEPIHSTLAALVPFGAKVAVDVGAVLSEYATALRGRGLSDCVIADPGPENIGRTPTLSEIASGTTAVEVVSIGSFSSVADSIEGALREVYDVLAEGGTVIARMTSRDFSTDGISSLSALEETFTRNGFHLLTCKLADDSDTHSDIIVRARKRTRPLVTIVTESLDGLEHVRRDYLTEWARSYGVNY